MLFPYIFCVKGYRVILKCQMSFCKAILLVKDSVVGGTDLELHIVHIASYIVILYAMHTFGLI